MLNRIRELAAATTVPLALHGETGIPDETMRELIEAGCVPSARDPPQ
jgi:fructose/tagatose bisphosphate aldolase